MCQHLPTEDELLLYMLWLVIQMPGGVEIKEREYHLRKYQSVLVASELISVR